MIETINSIEALSLFWMVRRVDTGLEKPLYKAAVWEGKAGHVMVTEEAFSPSIALGLAFEVAKRELNLPKGPPVPFTLPKAKRDEVP